jgi:hypothetical protein
MMRHREVVQDETCAMLLKQPAAGDFFSFSMIVVDLRN